MLPCLFREPEETEEDECAEDGSPSGGLERIDRDRVLVEQYPGVLEYARVSPVCVSPGDPWANMTQQEVLGYPPRGQRDGEAKIEGGQSHETPVAARRHAGLVGEYFPDLLSLLE